MNERKLWTLEEDQLLVKIMREEVSQSGKRKLKWNQIADRINQLCGKTQRRGKQCRQRWFNQLHPNINREQSWQPYEQKKLFQLQADLGNHWSKIAKGLPGRSDNNIKNYFYSCLRKALRKVNTYLYTNKRFNQYKNIKPFQKSTLSKILTVAQKNAEDKLLIADQAAPALAKAIKLLLIQAQDAQTQLAEETQNILFPSIISKIQEFNRICKRKKKKKKNTKAKLGNLPNQDIQEDSDIEYYSQIESDQQKCLQAEGESNSFSLIKNMKISSVKVENSFGSQVVKEEDMDRSHRQEQSKVEMVPKKVKSQVIIPLVRSNCSIRKELDFMEKQPNFGPLFKTSSDISTIQMQEQMRKRAMMPYFPFFPFNYIQGSQPVMNFQQTNPMLGPTNPIVAQFMSSPFAQGPVLNPSRRENRILIKSSIGEERRSS